MRDDQIFWRGRFWEISAAQQDRLADLGPAVWQGRLSWDQAVEQVLGLLPVAGSHNVGTGRGRANRHSAALWISPPCPTAVGQQLGLFGGGGDGGG